MYEQFMIIPIEICRICSDLQSDLNIQTETLEGENILIHEALEFVSCLKVDFDDGMSRTMCLACGRKLLDAYRFKNQILDSYRCFYNQTSDFKINLEESVESDDKNSCIHFEDNCGTVFEVKREDELDVGLSNDAISFLLEHHKTIKNKPPWIEQAQTNTTIAEHKQVISNQSFLTQESNSSNQELSLPGCTTTSILDNTTKLDKCKPAKDKFMCHICHKILPKSSCLKDHLRLHNNEKNFICPFCQKAFVQVANYRTHLRIHTKERPYRCHICSKTYSQGGALNIHIRTHTNEKNYVCDICYKAFPASSNLEKHKRNHDPSRHFACEICGGLFSQKVNLKVHLRNVHLKENQNANKL